MKLSKILNMNVDIDVDINGITVNSKEVKPGYLFVAIKGYIRDGHNYIKEAFNNGASVVIVDEERYDEFKNLGYIIPVKDSRDICSTIACNFYDNPSKDFTLIGITGTKGKTSTAYMIRNILMKAGKKVGMISTVASYINDIKISDNDRTTPEPFLLQKTFDLMRKEKCEYVVMEVSSQSLKLGRVNHSYFDIGMFLNLSDEHVSKNEHESKEDYFLCKAKLFDIVKVGFINIDDEYGKRILKEKDCNFITVSLNEITDLSISNRYTSFKTNLNNEEWDVYVPILGKFNALNALFSIKVCNYLKIDKTSIIKGLKESIIPGRSELVPNKLGLTIMIDYAHNTKSLESILVGLKSISKGKVITVFGCAGDRDNSKRKEMGRLSGILSDYTIITSDNPGTEDPNKICLEIESGIKEITNNYEIVIDREKAIKKAIKIANKEDIILLAGKGHENYQIIGEEKIPFSEKDIIKEL
ncbi:MAG: UDP-N-acetylmuramoyl-L-alanyl-D-glutamate--2,6-diaminopimelate ligase [Bacilli bacterium]|nr:UDP-N-acetylmuramoyl-L-alanyl-D-glutamate--2,6-diaminopimelate ligase [Bacilli bacterium]